MQLIIQKIEHYTNKIKTNYKEHKNRLEEDDYELTVIQNFFKNFQERKSEITAVILSEKDIQVQFLKKEENPYAAFLVKKVCEL